MIKRIAAVLSVAGLIAVAMFAGGMFAGASVAAVSDVSVVSSTGEQSGTVSEAEIDETLTADLADTAAEYDTIAGRWGIERIAVSAAWDAVDGFGPVLVAVLDTGIASDAPFAHRIVGSIDFSGEGNVEDAHGHGTHMAGTIAAIAPNARFLNVKVADKRGRCDTAAVAKAIRWATDNGAQVINVSLEVAPSADLDNAVSYAWEHGAIVVAAAGNSGSSAPAYPAAYPEALAVAGTNQVDGLAVLSNHGDWVDIAAPGFKIYAERPGADFGYETGTSPAAAHVSGVAALLFGIATDTSGDGSFNDEVRYALESSASPLPVEGTGSGVVNALSAMKALTD